MFFNICVVQGVPLGTPGPSLVVRHLERTKQAILAQHKKDTDQIIT
jgi:hypothetical protein